MHSIIRDDELPSANLPPSEDLHLRDPDTGEFLMDAEGRPIAIPITRANDPLGERQELVKLRAKEKHEGSKWIKTLSMSIHGIFMQLLYEKSKTHVKNHANYAATLRDVDALGLWRIIRDLGRIPNIISLVRLTSDETLLL